MFDNESCIYVDMGLLYIKWDYKNRDLISGIFRNVIES